MTRYAICICTRRRAKRLRYLLLSLARMNIPADGSVEVIVVENDSENFSEAVVREFSSYDSFRISYYLEPEQGLANARNRAVKESGDATFCCFVDDDQIVKQDWLTELSKCQMDFNSDGVQGVNPPLFGAYAPAWIKHFYDPDRRPYGAIVNRAFTNCLMIRKSCLEKLSGPFDMRLNFTGGEDSFLTSQLTGSGAVIRFNPNAIAFEVIPPERTNLLYVIRRTSRISNTELLIRSFLDKDFSRLETLGRLILRFCYGALISIPLLLFADKNKLGGILRMANAAGGLLFITGKYNHFYR